MRSAPLFITATLALAQQFHHFSGRVIDENGRPIAEAFFDNTAMPESEYAERFTNSEGRFDIWSNSLRIVLRKAGYRSIVLRPADANKHEFRMVKEKLK